MEYRFTYIQADGEEEISVCYGHNFMDCLWQFYSLYGTRNILLVEKIKEITLL